MEERLRRFVEQAGGGRVVAEERPRIGSSRSTTLLTVEAGGGRRELVLRVDAGDGPVAGTELSLAREATVYRALAGRPVRVPELLAAHPDGDAMLMERVAGEDALDDLAPEARTAVMDDYVDALAELHRLDVAELPLPGLHRPADGPDHARAELALWRGILDARVMRPAPLARFAFEWLERHAPQRVERTVLCHGDVGPGNFLHRDGRVTALLDWEFAHLGDPMDDLAWLAFRGHHMTGEVGELGAQLRRWSAGTGLPVDPARVAWYRALVMLRWLVSCLAALDHGAADQDRSVYFSLVPLLGALLPSALAELAGLALPPAAPPPEPEPTGEAEILASLLSDAGALAGAPEHGRRARGMALLLMHLQAADALGPAVRRTEVEQLAKLLGRPAGDPARALEEQVASSGPERDAEWIGAFAALGRRRLALWPFLAPLAAKPLAPIEAA